MKQEKDGTENIIFFDTYALFAIAVGQENYKKYTSGIKIITTIMNIYELYYTLIQANNFIEAELFFHKFLPHCIDIEPYIIKKSAKFRLQNKKLSLSYVDCLGYMIAQEMNILFLTGDSGFKNMKDVLFVK